MEYCSPENQPAETTTKRIWKSTNFSYLTCRTLFLFTSPLTQFPAVQIPSQTLPINQTYPTINFMLDPGEKQAKNKRQRDAKLHQQGHDQQRRRSHCPTQCLSGHAWNTMPSFSSHYKKMMWTIWRGSRAGHKDDQRAGELLYEERWEKWISTALKECLGESLGPHSSI